MAFDKVKYDNNFQKEKYDRIIVNVPKGQKAMIQAHVKELGKSVNAYVVDLINADMAAQDHNSPSTNTGTE